MLKKLYIRAIQIAGLAMLVPMGTAWAQASDPQVVDSVPDAVRLSEVQAELGDESRVRVLGEFFDLELSEPHVETGGITYGNVLSGHDGWETTPATITWVDIEQIQVRRSNALGGAITGAAFGGTLGLVTLAMVATSLDFDFGIPIAGLNGRGAIRPAGTGASIVITFIGAPTLVGTAAGALIGAPFHHWKTVYERY
jgi:hypothetical protein